MDTIIFENLVHNKSYKTTSRIFTRSDIIGKIGSNKCNLLINNFFLNNEINEYQLQFFKSLESLSQQIDQLYLLNEFLQLNLLSPFI